MDDGFTQLQQTFIAGLPDRFSRMQQLCEALTDRHNDTAKASLILLHRELHKLAGAAACYQCDEVRDCSESLEVWLEQHLAETSPLTHVQLDQLRSRLQRLEVICCHLPGFAIDTEPQRKE